MKETNVTLRFPAQFSGYINHEKSICFKGEKMSDFLNHLDDTYGKVKERLLESNGEVRPYINFFVGKKNIKVLKGLDTVIADGEKISLILSRAGG